MKPAGYPQALWIAWRKGLRPRAAREGAAGYIAFALAPITRQERADASRPFISAQYEPKLRAFLDFVLAQYVSEGVGELDQAKLPHLLELRYRAISDAALELGGVAKIREAFVGFQAHLYAR